MDHEPPPHALQATCHVPSFFPEPNEPNEPNELHSPYEPYEPNEPNELNEPVSRTPDHGPWTLDRPSLCLRPAFAVS
jgi:hypothetical protein